MIAHRAHQGLGFQGELGDPRLKAALHLNGEIGVLVHEVDQAPLGQALDQHLDPAVGELEHAHDHRHGADGVDIFGLRILLAHLLLGRQEDQSVPRQGRIDGGNRFFATHEQRDDHIRENHHIPHRKQGKFLGNLEFIFFLRLFQEILRWKLSFHEQTRKACRL